jgi:hypothetical protein
MKLSWAFLTSYLVIIPITAGLVRFDRIGRTYRPLFILLIAGLVTELISSYIIYLHKHSNANVSNIYALLEWILVFWQFRAWGFFRTNNRMLWTVLLLPCAVWITENLILGQMSNFSPYFRIFYCFLIVLLSVNKINFMITHDNRNLLGHPEFLICIAFIIYFTYDIIYEWAYQTSTTDKSYITTRIIWLFGYINGLTNIIFAIAFLRIPALKKIALW